MPVEYMLNGIIEHLLGITSVKNTDHCWKKEDRKLYCML